MLDTSKYDNLQPLQKARMFGLLEAEKERIEKEKPIRAQAQYVGEIIWISETIQLANVTQMFNKERKEYWQAVVDGRLTNYCHNTPEAAFLFGLGYKYDEQGNTRFHHFAARMLPGFEAYENQEKI